MSELEERESWAVVAAVIGFLSGAGLMSHAEILDLFTRNLYQFMVVDAASVTIHGKEMLAILSAAISYIAVLVMIGLAAGRLLWAADDVRVRYAALGVIFLVVSFLGTAVFSISRGYSPIEARMESLRATSGHPVIPKWDWK
jgi:hypothetical protein